MHKFYFSEFIFQVLLVVVLSEAMYRLHISPFNSADKNSREKPGNYCIVNLRGCNVIALKLIHVFGVFCLKKLSAGKERIGSHGEVRQRKGAKNLWVDVLFLLEVLCICSSIMRYRENHLHVEAAQIQFVVPVLSCQASCGPGLAYFKSWLSHHEHMRQFQFYAQGCLYLAGFLKMPLIFGAMAPVY